MVLKSLCLSSSLLLIVAFAGCGLESPSAHGTVSATANPLVALYSVASNTAGKVSVEFGLDTSYGMKTWSQPVTRFGSVDLLVAGMKAKTTYHMRAVAQFDDGTQAVDEDRVFTTGEIDPAQVPNITVTTTTGKTPQSGAELLAVVSGTAKPTVVDLSGKVIWLYGEVPEGTVANPIKLLPNGHFLINFSVGAVDGQKSVLREVDLAGTVIWEMTAADLNAALAQASCAGCNITVIGTHHDFVQLPNGHLIVIAAVEKDVSGTTVTGDVLIDLDQNHQPVWLWNEFDHLDTNRRPMSFPDWTHSNAVIYSPDDGNLIVSVRHQHWLVKVDYADGMGVGDVLWRMGNEGDFTLVGGAEPADWFYAQHGPSFIGDTNAGQFSLTLFDNGNNRLFPSDVTCDTGGAPPCSYSTVPLLQVDETAKTATIVRNPTTPEYSFFAGNADVLKNGNVEFCEAAGGPGTTALIYEVTPDADAQTVWRMEVDGLFLYRGQRIPSLYPGVQW